MCSQLEWSFLEVEEDEWQRRTCAPETAAAANGFPVARELGRHAAGGSPVQDEGAVPQAGCSPGALVAATLLLLLAAVAGFGAWYMAEQGLTYMAGEVTNAVKLQAVQSRVEQPAQHEQAAVEYVEFLDGKALVHAVITRTLPTGEVLTDPNQVQFYVKTPHGWQRTSPVAAFWGERQELFTPHLHFIFRRMDRAAVEELAPAMDALYICLQRALRQDLVAAGSRLAVEVMPARVPTYATLAAGRLQLASPYLYDLSFGYTSSEMLARQARQALVARMLDADLRQLLVKPQWQPLLDALLTWLQYSPALPLAPSAGPGRVLAGHAAATLPSMVDLLACTSPCACTAHGLLTAQDRSVALDSLVDYLITTYGLDILHPLLAGLSRCENWDTLAPALFGVSASQLEDAWHAWAQTEAK